MADQTTELSTGVGQRSGVNPWLIAITVTLATFMELLDTAIANVSLPHIAGGLATSYDESTFCCGPACLWNPRSRCAERSDLAI